MNKTKAFVDKSGKYHCSCGATHNRGAINGVNVYRCLKCGESHKVTRLEHLKT